jgi:ketosteroid isomerase-like protein
MIRAALITTCVLAGLARAAESQQTQESAAIQKAHADFIAAFNAGNLDRAFEFLSEDFLALVERQPTMDKATYRSLLAPFVAANKPDYTFEIDETVVSGDWAFERIRYQGSVAQGAAGRPGRVSWRAIAIWRRLPEGWRIARYIRTPDPQAGAARPR